MRTLILLVLSLAVLPALRAASFDCSKASSPIEKAICASPELSKADEEMARAYKSTMQALPENLKDELRQEQRRWLHTFRSDCTASGMLQEQVHSCILDTLSTRTKTLSKFLFTVGDVKFVHRSFYKEERYTNNTCNKSAAASGDLPCDHPGYFSADWPESLSDFAEWKVWNQAIYKQIMVPDPNDGAEHRAHQGSLENASIDTKTDVSVSFISESIVSAQISVYEYYHGAAHGNSSELSFNWLMHEGRTLQADDLFAAKSNWQAWLEEKTISYLKATVDDFAPEAQKQSVKDIVSNPSLWTIKRSGIEVTFPVYSVACRVCTPNPMLLTWDELKPFLNPSFVIPK